MAAKRADYFAAGTLVVWDVDPLAETVAVYLGVFPLPTSRSYFAVATSPTLSLRFPAGG